MFFLYVRVIICHLKLSHAFLKHNGGHQIKAEDQYHWEPILVQRMTGTNRTDTKNRSQEYRNMLVSTHHYFKLTALKPSEVKLQISN